MKPFLASIALLLLFTGALLAQPSTSALPDQPRFERLEGTIIQTHDGAEVKARLQYQAPDSLRLEIEENGAALETAQTIVATGDETRLYEPATKRVRRLPYNIAHEWWRAWSLQHGGPANLILFGLRATEAAKFYRVQTKSANFVTLAPRAEWIARQREQVRFGGSAASSFYAVLEGRVPLVPPIALQFAAGGQLQSRREFVELQDDANSSSAATTFAFTEWSADGWPRTAIVREETPETGHSIELGRFQYDLKLRAEPFPAETFQLLSAPGQIAEDAELRPLAAYSGGDVDTLFNKGVALALHTEDYAGAWKAWEAAALLAPQAVAPPLASFDLALAARETGRAQNALGHLTALLGANHFEVAMRRAQLAMLQRDWPTADAALQAAQQAHPQDRSVPLLRAELLRVRGEYSTAQETLRAVLQSDAPQPSTLVAAAEMLAAMSGTKEATALATTLPQENQWQRLARALLSLHAGEDAPAPELKNPLAQAALAQAYARAGWDEAALQLWRAAGENGTRELRSVAALHAMALTARRNAAEVSLQRYRALASPVASETEQQRARDVLLEAWRKNFRQDDLRQAIESRALALSADNADAKLWLAFQELYGTEADYAAALKAGLTRYGQTAWWQSRRASQLAAQFPEGYSSAVLATRERLLNEALAALDQAIRQAPQQPFYAVQRALLLTQNATMRAGIVDAARNVATRRAANAALDELAARWPDDPDVQLSVALQHLALEPEARSDSIAARLEAALRAGTPGHDATDRHLFVAAARQALASARRQQKRTADAAAQYELLLPAARDATEQIGLALNYLGLLASQSDAAGIARLAVRLAREPWEYSAWQEMQLAFMAALLQQPSLAQQVATLLRASDDPYAPLAAAQLDELLAQLAARDAARADAPIGADNVLAQATRARAATLARLAPLVTGDDPLLAGRAAATLAQAWLNRGDAELPAEDAARVRELLATAVAAQPHDVNLRFAMAQVLAATGQNAAAQTARDELVRSLPPTPQNLQRAAELSLLLNDSPTAVRLAERAVSVAQVEPEVAPAVLQQAALTLAHALLANKQTAPAMELYFKLALPQWQPTDRATALIDLQNRLRAQGQSTQAEAIEQRLRALDLTDEEMNEARANAAAL